MVSFGRYNQAYNEKILATLDLEKKSAFDLILPTMKRGIGSPSNARTY